MAIRFQCQSCEQPIEIDDEWASKLVVCPYCRKTVTAPEVSTLPEVSEVPVASPAAPPTPPSGPSSARDELSPPPVPAAEAHPNRIAIAALVLGLIEILLMVMMYQVMAHHRLEMEEFVKAVEGAESLSEMMKRQQQFFDERGGVPRWMVMSVMFYLAAAANWFPLVICSGIGVMRPRRRGFAVFGLVVSGVVLVMLCCGALLSPA